jgi:hypothetical protein
MMRGRLSTFVVTLCILLTGCATTIQSEVTAFHEWPDELRNKSFVFERTSEQQNNLEHRAYENLVRAELLRLGLVESANPQAAGLKVALNYNIDVRDVRVVEPVLLSPWYGSPFYGYGYGPRWHGHGYYSPFYGPYHSPFWYAPPIVQQRETRYQLANRQLKIVISRAEDSRKLYDVTVSSEGTNTSLAAVMPYMVRSAFADFPGKSGVPRRIELKMKD